MCCTQPIEMQLKVIRKNKIYGKCRHVYSLNIEMDDGQTQGFLAFTRTPRDTPQLKNLAYKTLE
jgi:hypothetical protein